MTSSAPRSASVAGSSPFQVAALAKLPLTPAQGAILRLLGGERLSRAELRWVRRLTRASKGKPRPGQYRRVWLRLGRRSGKSTRLAACAVVSAAMKPNPSSLAPGEQAYVIASAPTRPLCVTLLDSVSGILKLLGVKHEKLSFSIRIPSARTVVEVATGDVVSGRSKTAKLCLLEETGAFPSDESAAGNLQSVISALAPTLATTGGAMLLIGTPLDRGGRFNQQVESLLGDVSGDEIAMTGPTWEINSNITEANTRKLEPNERAWLREYAATPGDDVSAALARDAVMGCVRDIGATPDAVVAGFDQSGGKHDAFALVCAGRILHRPHPSMPLDDLVVVTLAREWRPSKLISWRIHRKVADEVANIARAHRAKVRLDGYGGSHWVGELRDRGVPTEQVSMAQSAQGPRFKLLIDLISSRRLVLPRDCPELIRQLCELREKVSDGRTTYAAPRRTGAHDDLVDALAVAVEAASQLPPSGNIERVTSVVRNSDGRPSGIETRYLEKRIDPRTGSHYFMPIAPPSGTLEGEQARRARQLAGVYTPEDFEDETRAAPTPLNIPVKN